MEEDRFDPISVEIPDPVDRRLARLTLSPDNSPRQSDGSVELRGSVTLGLSPRVGASGRRYEVGVKSAFLEVFESECQFEPNLTLQDKVQHGTKKVNRSLGEGANRNAGIATWAAGTASAIAIGVRGSAQERFSRSIKRTETLKPELWRVHWEASGWAFGERRSGDPLTEDGLLTGSLLIGTWGRLAPERRTQPYSAHVALRVAKGGLRVRPEEWGFRSLLPGGNESDVFDALKSAVAGWAIEDEFARRLPQNGFDAGTGELVLAGALITVNPALPTSNAQQLGSFAGALPALPIPDTQSKTGKLTVPPTRRSRPPTNG